MPPRWRTLSEPPLHIDTVETHLDPSNEYPLYVRQGETPDSITEVWVVTTGSVLELRYDYATEQWEKDVHHHGNAADTVREALTDDSNAWVNVQEYDSLDATVDVDDDDMDLGDIFDRTTVSVSKRETSSGSYTIHFARDADGE